MSVLLSIEARMHILIPEAAGGLRLRYDVRPWIMDSVHYVDNAGRNDTLKWSVAKASLDSFIACKQEPGSKQLTSLRIVPLIGQCGEMYIQYQQDDVGRNVRRVSIRHTSLCGTFSEGACLKDSKLCLYFHYLDKA
jgi:hypothetical protein